ncbi:Oidioi.mRNA.OKI2018_I69.chr1.g838.t1.cds [Oikopleura dioica]|uniref:Protein KRI1 homolog n=1 Tax=Oikopleura dioica TaxID=34765 RepID=A0ABN7SL42_OIKDI|nr:Oidioi.mRNA.OKI2018_I69.chr1.g838.t1.cds [Oikopleura dioica]
MTRTDEKRHYSASKTALGHQMKNQLPRKKRKTRSSPKKSTLGFLKTLDALKRNDPSIYDSKTKFYETDSEEDENEKTKTEKSLTLKDYERNVVLKKGGIVDEEAEEMEELTRPSTSGKSHKEEQEEIKSEFAKLAESDSGSDSEDEIFSKKAIKSGVATEKDIDWDLLANKNLDEKEKFVKQYLMNAAWNEDESDQDYSSGEELVALKYHKENGKAAQESSEEEESDGEDLFSSRKLETDEVKESVDVLKTKFEREESREPKAYPRNGVPDSLRQDTKSEAKAKKRQEKKERKMKKEKEYKENMARMKHIKEEELMAKMEELKSALGVSDIDIDPSLLKGDFDPDKHEELVEKLAANLGEDEFDENGELIKPVFSDLEEWEEEQAETKRKAKKERKQKKKRGGRGRIRETDDYEEAKEKFPEIAKEIDELDYQVDMVGDTACKFRYREVDKEDYGLTADELLNATDAELNQWVGLKRVTQWKDDGFTKNKFWTNPKKIEAKKKQIFKSIYGDEYEVEKAQEPKKNRKINSKRRRKLKERQLLEEGEDQEEKSEEEPAQEVEKKEKKIKKKRKHKGQLDNITDDRFSSYGLTKDEIKKIKYDPENALKYKT